jgi:hypothetical protein
MVIFSHQGEDLEVELMSAKYYIFGPLNLHLLNL